MRSGIDERCTSLSTTEPSSAPLIGFSPTVPTTIVLRADLLRDGEDHVGRAVPATMRDDVSIPAASRSRDGSRDRVRAHLLEALL